MLIGNAGNVDSTSEWIRTIKRKNIVRPLVRVLSRGQLCAELAERELSLISSWLDLDIIWIGAQSPSGFALAKGTWERALVELLPDGFIASSANLTGHSTPASLSEVPEEILAKVGFIYDVGTLPKRPDYGVLSISDWSVHRGNPDLRAFLESRNISA